MNYKFQIILIGSYLLAFSVNLMPALKHPDLNINIFNLLVTLLFMFLLLMYLKKGSKILKLFSIVDVISGILVFVIASFESTMIGNGILDLIVSIQYPFYFYHPSIWWQYVIRFKLRSVLIVDVTFLRNCIHFNNLFKKERCPIWLTYTNNESHSRIRHLALISNKNIQIWLAK